MTTDTYETHAVAFIDILGFSNIVKKSQHQPEICSWLRALFYSLDETNSTIANDNRIMTELNCVHFQSSGKFLHSHMVAFSDSIVFSITAKLSPYLAIKAIADLTADLCYKLLDFGYITRGGIDLGGLFHEGNVVFGPALIEAYRLESEEAIYPRILFSKAAAQCVVGNFGYGDHEFTIILNDRDGLQYLNILAHAVDLGITFNYDSLGRIRNTLVRSKEEASNSRHLDKINWYIDYFNNTLDLLNERRVKLINHVERIH